MVEAKHEFIDDNPYLVYSPDAEATANGSGGGIPVIEVNGEGALSVTAGTLKNMMQSSPVAFSMLDDELLFWNILITYGDTGDAIVFKTVTVDFTSGNVVSFAFAADSDDDYPTISH